MLRWLFRFVVLALVAVGFYQLAFDNAPDLNLPSPGGEILAANLPGDRPTQPDVRVLVADALPDAILTINGRVRILARNMQMEWERGEFTQSVAVDIAPTGQGIKVGAHRYVRVRLKNLDSQPLRISWNVDNKQVTVAIPHEIEIYGTHVVQNNRNVPRIRILAHVPMEEYLYGVVPGEMPSSWPLETLRAQAVASRTYAYFAVKSRVHEEYDVHAGIRSQVWRPSLAVEPQVRRAVDSTAGIVLTEKNALIRTYFHSECGGFTADARWVFTKTPILALSGVRCPRCTSVRPSSWSVTYTRQEIANRLRKEGLLRHRGEIRVLQGLDANGNPMGGNLGRVVTVEITMAGDRGAAVRIPANEFRLAIGHDKSNVASTYMTISGGDEARITFSGFGWGHGVGLCQHGAHYAADKLRYNFLDILALYYPGAKPVRLWGR